MKPIGMAGMILLAVAAHAQKHWVPGVVISTNENRFAPVDVVKLPETVSLDLPGLPRGKQSLGGSSWNVRSKPLTVSGAHELKLDIKGKVTELKILQTALGGKDIAAWRAAVAESHRGHSVRPDYPVIGRYTFHYRNGDRAVVPLRWGEGIQHAGRRTFEPVSRFAGPMGWAHIAWQGPQDYDNDVWPTVYVTRVPNPRPELDVQSVIFSGAESNWGSLAVLDWRNEDTPLPGRLLFVSPSGDDANPGTFDKPFRSPQHAANTAQPGDTIYFRAGTYPVSDPVMPLVSGEEGKWITYSGYPGETAIIDGNALYTDNLPNNKNYYAVELGDRLIEMLASRTGTFHIFKRNYIRVQNLSIHRSPFVGISVDNAQRSWMQKHDPDYKLSSHHLDFLFNRVVQSAQCGLGVYANYNMEPKTPVRHVRAIGNQILHAYDYDFTQTTTGPGHQADTRDAMRGIKNRHGGKSSSFGDENLDFHGVHYLEVGYNEVFAGGKEGIDLMIATRHARVHHNFVHENFIFYHFGGGKMGIYLDNRRHQWDIEVDHNVVKQAGTGIVSTNEDGKEGKNIRIHHNLVLDNQWSGMGLWANEDPKFKVHLHDIYNNTCYKDGYFIRNKNPGGGMDIGRPANLLDIQIRNNIMAEGRDYTIIVDRKIEMEKNRIDIDHNLQWPKDYSPLPGKRGKRSKHYTSAHALNAEPDFIDPKNWNFNLKPGSPAIDAGDPALKDADGTRSDIGAFPRLKDGVKSSWAAPTESLY